MIFHLLVYLIFRDASPGPVGASSIFINTTSPNFSLPMTVSLNATLVSNSSPACSCNQRDVLDIVWSCASTLFLCTWVSVHPNVPAPGEEGWRILWRRLKAMFWAMVVPEMILTWAARQHTGAIFIYKIFTEDRNQANWTMKHSHFLQMGGFHLRSEKYNGVLYPSQAELLLSKGEISFSSITEADIEDRSKSDALSKIILINQTLWFVVQCIGRRAQGLAVVQLELATLAVISCTFLLSLFWWSKPLDVRQPIYLNVVSKQDGNETHSSQNLGLERIYRPRESYIFSADNSGRHSQVTSSDTDENERGPRVMAKPPSANLSQDTELEGPLSSTTYPTRENHNFPVEDSAGQHIYSEDIIITTDAMPPVPSQVIHYGIDRNKDFGLLRLAVEPIPGMHTDSSQNVEFDGPLRNITYRSRENHNFPATDRVGQHIYNGEDITTYPLEYPPPEAIPYQPTSRKRAGSISSYQSPTRTRRRTSYNLKHDYLLSLKDHLVQTVTSIFKAIVDAVAESLREKGLSQTIVNIIIIWPIIDPLRDIVLTVQGDIKGAGDKRVRSYFASTFFDPERVPVRLTDEFLQWGHSLRLSILIIFPCSALFGAIHCIAWNSHFPSSPEKTIWRVSAIVVTATGCSFTTFSAVKIFKDKVPDFAQGMLLVLPVVYVVARCILLVESLTSLRGLLPSALETVSWSNFLPHL